MQNRYPWWKNLFLVILFIVGLVYAAPNLFPTDPAVQISSRGTATITPQVEQQVKSTLQKAKLDYLAIGEVKDCLLVRFPNTDTQLKAREEISALLGDKYIVALNLAPRTPHWLEALGAEPLKLGLDLRGGVYFLLEVDVDTLLESREQGDLHAMGDALREANIRYTGITRLKPNGIEIRFRDQNTLNQAYNKLSGKPWRMQ